MSIINKKPVTHTRSIINPIIPATLSITCIKVFSAKGCKRADVIFSKIKYINSCNTGAAAMTVTTTIPLIPIPFFIIIPEP